MRVIKDNNQEGVYHFEETEEEIALKELNQKLFPIVDKTNIDEYKKYLITQSKEKLQQFLEDNPLLFTDEKYYNVTQEKQNLLNNAITIYQMKLQSGLPAELKWNATGEECTIWTLENISALALTIAEYIEPLVTYQQAKEVEINNCITTEELDAIVIDYVTV